MNDRRRSWLAALVLLASASCSGASQTHAGAPDSGPAESGRPLPDASPGDSPRVDAGPLPDSSSPKDASPDASACVPTPGSMAVTGECDNVQIAVLRQASGPSTVSVMGRLNVGSFMSPACTVVDAIDVTQGGSTLDTIPGTAHDVPSDGSLYPLAQGTPTSALEALCQSDKGRFDAVGLVVRGHTDGGSFTTKCGDNTPDTGWPPRVVITCHTGLDAMPLSPTDATVMTSSFMGKTFTMEQVFALIPQPPVLSTIDGKVHIVPQAAPFSSGMPLEPFDTTGWMGATDTMMEPDGTAASNVTLFNSNDVLGAALCTPGCTMPPCGIGMTPPVFLARITGTLSSGTFESELYVPLCTR